jgi:hypothetical protein
MTSNNIFYIQEKQKHRVPSGGARESRSCGKISNKPTTRTLAPKSRTNWVEVETQEKGNKPEF